MNSRERVLKAINHEEPDRVPLFCQAIMPDFKNRILEYWGDDYKRERRLVINLQDFNIQKKLGFDAAWGAVGLPIRPPHQLFKEHPVPTHENPNYYVDYDGRVSLRETKFNTAWYIRNYITTEEMADFFYETYWNIEWRPTIRYAERVNKKLAKFGTDEFVPCSHLLAILEPMWEGLGLGLLTKLIRKKKDKVKRYIDLRTKIGVEHAKIGSETDFDIFFLCDDTAYKKRPMMNPKIHRELIIPAYKKIVQVIRKAGKFAVFHSDGFTEPYFDGLIEAGFHGVESLEPFAGMDLKHLKETYGDKLCLIGNIDVSGLLPFGTTDEVVESVKKCIKDAGEGGGYILSPCTDITDSCKLDNVLTMIEATKKYGKYPLSI